MSDLLWNKQGETLSHKNACQEFGLTEEEIFDAMKSGKLQYRENSAHGNPYFRLLRNEVKLLAQDLHGDKSAKEQEMKHELQKINQEINSLKRKLTSLEKQKLKLIEEQK
jgi:ABC-type phosphate transport system auxiliary subunit